MRAPILMGRLLHALRRGAVLALVSASVGACSSQGATDYAQLLKYAEQAWSGKGKMITLEQASAVPYASIAVQIGDGPQKMLVLAATSGDDRLWTSASHIVLATRDGRIVRSSGLAHDLTSLAPTTTAPTAAPLTELGAPSTRTLVADFHDLNVYSTPITCRSQRLGAATITILGSRVDTDRIDEHCEDRALNWDFVNSYWIDPATGIVWRSIQHIHPDFDAITVETLRPPKT